jgi:hypothetical protein
MSDPEHWRKTLPTHQRIAMPKSTSLDSSNVGQCAANYTLRIGHCGNFSILFPAPRNAAYFALAVLSVQDANTHRHFSLLYWALICIYLR